MTAENIICLVILIICAVPLIVLGIFQMKSKEPVGFWSGVKPPSGEKVSDVEAYNKGHGIMWIIYGAGILPAFYMGLPIGEGIGAAWGIGIEVFGGLFLMIWYHNYLVKKYVKK